MRGHSITLIAQREKSDALQMFEGALVILDSCMSYPWLPTKLPQTEQLKTIDVHFLTVSVVRNLGAALQAASASRSQEPAVKVLVRLHLRLKG